MARSCQRKGPLPSNCPAYRRIVTTGSLFTLLLASSFTTASLVGASTVKHAPTVRTTQTDSAVAPDKAYYKGKTITMYVYGSVGGGVDVAERTLAPYIAAYLHCTVNVTNVVGGGTIPGQNLAEAQPPNGLTIGSVNVIGDIGDFVTNTPGLAFNLRSIPLLASTPASNFVVVNTPSSGYASLKQMIGAAAPISVLAEANSTNQVYEQLLFGAFHIPNKFIYGYGSTAALVTGFTRGDGASESASYSNVGALIVGHQAIPVLQSVAASKGEPGFSIMRKVPTLAQFLASNPPKTKDGKIEARMLENLYAVGTAYAVPPGTPAKFQAALNDAIEFASTRGGAESQLASIGDPPGYVLPATIKKSIVAVLAQQQQLTTWLKRTGAPPA